MTEQNKERAVEMFKMRLEGATYQEIADKYGVTRQCVHQILGIGTVNGGKKYEAIIYKGLRNWMKENKLSALYLHRLIFPSATSGNTSVTRDRLNGTKQFKLSEIIVIIKKSGLTFEELFMQE